MKLYAAGRISDPETPATVNRCNAHLKQGAYRVTLRPCFSELFRVLKEFFIHKR